MDLPQYLIRPNDFHIFELDPFNSCYRSYSTHVTYSDGTKPNAQSHFTFQNLTENYDFFSVKEEELLQWEEKHALYMSFLSWACRSDSHGGSKGGTMEEFLCRIGAKTHFRN